MSDQTRKHKILFVPGKNPKPLPEEHRALVWRCLRRGVELVDPAVAQDLGANPDCLQLVAWNAIYYQKIKDIEEDLPWLELLCHKAGPSAEDVREALSWRNKRARWLYTLADFFPALIPMLPDPAVKSTIQETERYFRNVGSIGARVRELVKSPVRQMLDAGDRVLIIGHSMGSVIAYDALWELTHVDRHPGKIELFISIGSPLGMNFVQERLLGFRQQDGQRFPCNIRHWINIAAHGDLTALDPVLRDDFLPMLKQGCIESIEDRHRGVFNYFRNAEGLNEHRSYGYLVEQHVARAVVAWWRGGAGMASDAAVSLAGDGGIA